MRRRSKENGRNAPPLPLTRFRGSNTREALDWIRERQAWWDAQHDEDHAGWLPWIVDGWDQVGDLPWCGSVGTPCGNADCLCVAWPEHVDRDDSTQPRRTAQGSN